MEAIERGDRFVREHPIYKSFCETEDTGNQNGARWLARDAYQAGHNDGQRDFLLWGRKVYAAYLDYDGGLDLARYMEELKHLLDKHSEYGGILR